MKNLVVASNMFNEIDQLEEWYENMCHIASAGILIVDTGSDDGTKEFFESKHNVVFITDDIILREGYGPARNHLRDMSKKHYPDAHWMVYLDADERIDPEDYHTIRFLCDYLVDDYDVVALPRIDWKDLERTEMAKDWRIQPDYQARMSRLNSNVTYHRKLHEQVLTQKQLYAQITNPKINHFHRCTPQEKRDYVGKVCAKLHMEDEEHGHTYPEHHKEAEYRKRLEEEGL